MPVEKISGTELSYHLIAYDSAGRERTDDPDGRMSQVILDVLAARPITDVFVMSHGWKGDIPAAREQYVKWIRAMAECCDDIAHLKRVRPGFTPLIVGIHWASLPWGNEEFGAGGAISLGVAGNIEATCSPIIAQLVDAYAERLADTAEARRALETIFQAAAQNIAPPEIPMPVHAAYCVLERETQLAAAGEGSAPGTDHDRFDPEKIYRDALRLDPAHFGSPSIGGILSPLRQLSFWKMKDRARRLGETAGICLLRSMMLQSRPEGTDTHFHFMGHSFGCIVVSAMLHDLPHSVDSLTLVQGAMSLWSFCTDIPKAHGTSGYFRRVIDQQTVSGPIITTQSRFDTAVGRFYPLGAGVAGQVSFAPPGAAATDPALLPKYGGLGTFGVQGPGLKIVPLEMHPLTDPYDFSPHKVYNVDGSRYICHGSGASGAHGDVALPEVAHAMWAAVYTH
jgi:hypothetical protein